ncbi:MAG: bifunctional DNA-binding transcriptional regulator/O6-methylguanine-DNA methyltransferase Ada [Acidobacteriota bacterium]|nr:bifunctional DNA-binding transcriptional regulator/O6-methylguanine-DNA methyltransferase Ada [Acidobacteriota bacterium]
MLDPTTLWQAVQAKDKSLDGQFLYGVLTTKVFCRPGCPSRPPKRENVRFYETAQEAQADGLRACLRCKPLDSNMDAARAKFQTVCTFIRCHLEDREALRLPNLSRRFELSPFHFQRTFKAIVGVTPRQYVEALRMQTLKEDLKTSSSVTDAIYSAGFGSSSRVYDRVDTRLGMTPKEYRSGGKDVEISYVIVKTPLGRMMLGATDRGLCFLEFGSSPEELLVSLQQEYPASVRVPLEKPYSDQFTGWMQALASYLEGERTLQPMPISLHGTAFQLKVWSYLQTIRAGSVQSYSEVAEAIGHPKAVRAVASACAANRIALVVPCHRVIRGDGGLGGYRWGLDRKRTLLDAERRTAARAKA